MEDATFESNQCSSCSSTKIPHPVWEYDSRLYSSVCRGEWETARLLLNDDSDPSLVHGYCRYVDPGPVNQGETVLHAACYAHPRSPAPLDVVQAVYRAFPAAVWVRNDLYGCTPLLLACIHATEAVVLFLLEVTPETARVPNRYEWYPLHRAVDDRRSPRIVRGLLEAYPVPLTRATQHGPPALTKFVKRWVPHLKGNDDGDGEHASRLPNGRDTDGHTTLLGTLLCILRTLAACTARDDNSTTTNVPLPLLMAQHRSLSSSFSPIHHIFTYSDLVFPAPLKYFLLQCLPPEQLWTPDDSGAADNLPLHLLLSHAPQHRKHVLLEHLLDHLFQRQRRDQRRIRQRLDLMSILDQQITDQHRNSYWLVDVMVTAMTTTISTTMESLSQQKRQLLLRNKQGHTPLLVLLRYGRVAVGDNKATTTTWKIVHRLLKAFPEHIYVTDPDNGLYPFMVAATEAGKEDNDNNDDVSIILELLRMTPELVGNGVP